MSFLDSFLKVTKRSRMMVTIQHRIILSPFKRQSTNQYKIVFCVYQISVWTRSQILMLRSKPFICRAEPDSIVSVRTLLFDSLCNAMVLITEFSSACSLETNPSVYYLEKQNAVFLRSHAFFFVLIFFCLLFFFFGGGGLKFKIRCCEFHEFYLVLMPSAANIYIR